MPLRLILTALTASLLLSSCATVRPNETRGLATWYGEEFHGRRTASGERFNRFALTAAHRSLPLGSRVRVTDVSTKRSVDVRINDRGPYAHDAIIDLSYEAARQLGILRAGRALVELKKLD